GLNRRAEASYRAAVRAARACGCLEREAKALNNLGTVAQWLGDVRGAEEAFSRSIALKERAGARTSALATYNNLGAMQLALGAHDEARANLERALGEPGLVSPVVACIAGSNLGDLEVVRGRLDAGIARYREALALCRARSFDTQQTHVMAGLARALMMRRGPGDEGEATALVEELGRYARDFDMAEAQRRYHTTAAVEADLLGDAALALEHARAAVATRDRVTRFSDVLGTPLEAQWILALALARAGRAGEADRAAERCRRALGRLGGMIEDAADRARFLAQNPVHAAIRRGALDLPRGWTWPPQE
ncbi:MAG TPA: tetratricopeptide repeat protein, partial [Candidatus Nanopelagicales bacterium]|nr:tetratricopeptide repeat protein [Candidatus Nanopelagicales bacterium]